MESLTNIIIIIIIVKPEILVAEIFSVLGIHGMLAAIKFSLLCMHSYIKKNYETNITT